MIISHNISDKELLDGIKRCISMNCGEKCFLYSESKDCSFKLLDIIISRMGIMPEDYADYVIKNTKESME